MRLAFVFFGLGLWILGAVVAANQWSVLTSDQQSEVFGKLILVPVGLMCLPLLMIPSSYFYGILGGAPSVSIGYFSSLVWRYRYRYLLVGMAVGGLLTFSFLM